MSESEIKYLEYLPEYIQGNISDEELKKEIEKELKTNEKLKEEYEKFKTIFSEFEETNAFNPPENYFNSLLPRINERIDKSVLRKLKQLIINWKFAISLALLILLFISYKLINNSNDNHTIEITLSDSSVLTEKEPIFDTSVVNNEIKIENYETLGNLKEKYLKNINTNKVIETEKINESNQIEFFEEDDIIDTYEEYFDPEYEFRKLPYDEQQKVLENFENLKI